MIFPYVKHTALHSVVITEFYSIFSQKFREINYQLSTKELYSKLIWRKKLLFQSVWFHEKNSNFIDMIQSQNFRQITFWLKNFTLSWFDEKKLLFKQCVISRKKNHQIDFLFTKCFSTWLALHTKKSFLRRKYWLYISILSQSPISPIPILRLHCYVTANGLLNEFGQIGHDGFRTLNAA